MGLDKQATRKRRDWYAVICDQFDVDHFRQIVNQSDRLQKLELKGVEAGPTFPPLLQDVYNVLYKPAPQANPDVAQEYEINRMVIEELQLIPDYESLHRMTQLDVYSSAIGTISLGETAIEVLNRFRKQLEEAQQQAQQEQQKAQQNPNDQQTRKRAEQAQQKLQAQRDRLRQELRKAVQQTKNKVQEAQAAESMWGLNDVPAGETDIGERLKLAEMLLNDFHLKKIAEILGRVEVISQQVQKGRYRFDASEVTSVELGKNLEHLLPGELVKLRHPMLRKDWQRRFVEGQLMEYRLMHKAPLGRGPIVACVDESGSMSGTRDEWAKAVTLALAKIAKRQGRDFVFIPFSIQYEVLEYPGGKVDVLKIARHMYGGGTMFSYPLERAFEVLGSSQYKRGDLIFITDGQADISRAFSAALREKKEKLGVRAVGVLIGGEAAWTEPMEMLFDSHARVYMDARGANDTEALKLVFSV